MKSISKLKIRVKRDFQDWLEETHNQFTSVFVVRPRIECNDGFSMSVQGGEFTYSNPREYGLRFESMEVGFPSEYEELIREYASDEDFTETIYPYVPTDVILEVIKKHGGMKKN